MLRYHLARWVRGAGELRSFGGSADLHRDYGCIPGIGGSVGANGLLSGWRNVQREYRSLCAVECHHVHDSGNCCPSSYRDFDEMTMRYRAPVVDDPNAGPGLNDIAAHVVRKVVSQNPIASAIYEEMEPEINGLLKEAVGNHKPDMKAIHDVTSRTGRVIQRIAQKTKQGKTA